MSFHGSVAHFFLAPRDSPSLGSGTGWRSRPLAWPPLTPRGGLQVSPPRQEPPLQHCHGDPSSLVPACRGRQPRLPSWPAEAGARARHVYRVFGSAGFCLTFPVSLARPFPGPKNRICYFYKTIFKLFIKYLVFIRFQSVRFHSQCCGIHHTLLNNR